jgi:hypothetical protein
MNSPACAVAIRPASRRGICLASVIAAWLLNVAMFLNIFVLQGT